MRSWKSKLSQTMGKLWNKVKVVLFTHTGEMWVGVALAVLVELVGSKFKTTAIAVYLFVITNIGGCVPLLVPPIQQLFENNGYSMSDALRGENKRFYILKWLLSKCTSGKDNENIMST